jgi:4-diphosphocytidyl-2-C-methyl-D-erythritol kinase
MLERAAPAKINLGLHVLRKRDDGYHAIETVMHRIGWADRITVAPADALTMTCSDPTLPTDADNLCLQAAQRLQAAFEVEQGARLHLDKHVPYGAGLGSGSSDAATTLQLLDALWELDAAPEALHAIAAQVGSDAPFFLDGSAALATGRGDELTPLRDAAGAPYAMPFALVVVVPDVHIATPEAYGLVRPRAGGRPDLAEVVRSNDLARWRAELANDFEAPIAEAYPAVGAVREVLDTAGAGYVALSGSGSAVYGVFEQARAARAAEEAAQAAGYRVHRDA